jgi:hypothetical protein
VPVVGKSEKTPTGWVYREYDREGQVTSEVPVPTKKQGETTRKGRTKELQRNRREARAAGLSETERNFVQSEPGSAPFYAGQRPEDAPESLEITKEWYDAGKHGRTFGGYKTLVNARQLGEEIHPDWYGLFPDLAQVKPTGRRRRITPAPAAPPLKTLAQTPRPVAPVRPAPPEAPEAAPEAPPPAKIVDKKGQALVPGFAEAAAATPEITEGNLPGEMFTPEAEAIRKRKGPPPKAPEQAELPAAPAAPKPPTETDDIIAWAESPDALDQGFRGEISERLEAMELVAQSDPQGSKWSADAIHRAANVARRREAKAAKAPPKAAPAGRPTVDAEGKPIKYVEPPPAMKAAAAQLEGELEGKKPPGVPAIKPLKEVALSEQQADHLDRWFKARKIGKEEQRGGIDRSRLFGTMQIANGALRNLSGATADYANAKLLRPSPGLKRAEIERRKRNARMNRDTYRSVYSTALETLKAEATAMGATVGHRSGRRSRPRSSCRARRGRSRRWTPTATWTRPGSRPSPSASHSIGMKCRWPTTRSCARSSRRSSRSRPGSRPGRSPRRSGRTRSPRVLRGWATTPSATSP